MSRTPAAELARLKIAFPDWTIRREPPGRGGGFVARRRLPGGRWQSRRGATVAELEYELRLLDKGDQPG